MPFDVERVLLPAVMGHLAEGNVCRAWFALVLPIRSSIDKDMKLPRGGASESEGVFRIECAPTHASQCTHGLQLTLQYHVLHACRNLPRRPLGVVPPRHRFVEQQRTNPHFNVPQRQSTVQPLALIHPMVWVGYVLSKRFSHSFSV